ncbi:protein-L-isoaspartate(D-aspartate) O-methyltransferase [bacterium]|nr:protein-L-isoaspartate(D-aspartate) O-methyltransferase [bacterium]
MVSDQLEARGIRDTRVLEAFRKVPRHLFMGESHRFEAYSDHPVAIGEGQTISQPYIIALMTQALEIQPEDKVLEIGTGSGYQTAILAELTKNVFSIETIPVLAERSRKILLEHGYNLINFKLGDGFFGWPEEAPFDKIIITAAPRTIPPPLLEQLKVGGKLVLPRGDWTQKLVLVVKNADGKIVEEILSGVIFVPMTGKAQEGKY